MGLEWTAEGTVVTPSTNVLAAQVLDWTQAEGIADVGLTPQVLEIEVFT